MRFTLFPLLFAISCGTAAQQAGIGRECNDADDCGEDRQCLDEFAGGYCAITCDDDDDCPDGSACVTSEAGTNACFLLCLDKPECNTAREDFEANCASNITYVEARSEGIKACVPPSSGEG